MKPKQLLYLSALAALVACGDKAAREQAARQAPAIEPARADEAVALGRIEPEDKLVSLAAEGSGVVRRLLVREGQTVRAGQPLLELDQDVETARLREAESKLITQQARIAADRAAAQGAGVRADNLRRTAERVAGLAAQGAETPQAADDARTEADAQAREAARLRGQSQARERELTELRQAAHVSRAELARRTVRAVQAGTLLKLDAVPGTRVAEGKPLGDFAPAGRLTALCEVDELLAGRVRPGQLAYLRNQGATDTLATGTVLTAAPYLKRKSLFAETAGEAEDRRVREVRVLLTGPASGLLFNSRVECVIRLTATPSPTAGGWAR